MTLLSVAASSRATPSAPATAATYAFVRVVPLERMPLTHTVVAARLSRCHATARPAETLALGLMR